MPTITLLTSNTTNAPYPSDMPTGRAAVATSSSGPALYLTSSENSAISICPAVYDLTGFATGKTFQLVYRVSSKELVIYDKSGNANLCRGGLQGITDSNTTMLGVPPTTGVLTPVAGMTCLSPKIPLGGGTSNSVVIYPGDDRVIPSDTGNTSIGARWYGSDTTSICPYAPGDPQGNMPAYYATLLGRVRANNVPAASRVTAIGMSSLSLGAGSDVNWVTTVGGLSGTRDPRLTFAVTLVSPSQLGGGTSVNIAYTFASFGADWLPDNGSGTLNGTSFGSGVNPFNNGIVIGATGWKPFTYNSGKPFIAIYGPNRPVSTSSQGGICIGNGTDAKGGDTVLLGTSLTTRLAINESGAFSFSSLSSWGTSGQILSSSGTAGPPVWKNAPAYTFTSADGKTITVTDGLITSIS